jgi:argininosuccinate lyase
MAGLATVKAAHFTHTGDGNRESMRNLWEAADEAHHIAAMLELVLRTVRPAEARMRKRAQGDFGTATELADLLVRDCGLSFRESHHVVGSVVRAALDGGLDASAIDAALIDRAAREQVGRTLGLAEDHVRAALDPAGAVSSRGATGGPAPDTVRARSRELQRQTLAMREANALRRNRHAETRAALKSAIRALAAGARPGV